MSRRTLGDLIESVSDTFAFDGKEVVFLNTSDIYEGKVLKHSFESSTGLPGQAKKSIKKGDLLFSEIRPANRRYAYVDFVSDRYVVSTKLMVLRSKGEIDGRFLQIFLTRPSMLSYLQGIAENRSGTFPQITFDQIAELEIDLPPMEDQLEIATQYFVFEKKIELNRRMNQTLEAIAQAIFKSWFVDFDPVRANMEGRPTGLPKGIEDLFPDKLVQSEIGLVPEGWRVEEIGKHIDGVKGLSYKGAGLSTSGMPLHNLNSIYEGGGYKSHGIKYYNGEYRERHLCCPGDIVVANTEQGFDYLLIGYPAIIPPEFGSQGLFTHHLYKLNLDSASPLRSFYIYFLLLDSNFRERLVGFTNGTTVNSLHVDGLRKPKICIPPYGLVELFCAMAESHTKRMQSNMAEVRTLSLVREKLLLRMFARNISAASFTN